MNHEKMTNTDLKLCLAPGTTLGKNYQIIKMIGKGGMGSVYLACSPRFPRFPRFPFMTISELFLGMSDSPGYAGNSTQSSSCDSLVCMESSEKSSELLKENIALMKSRKNNRMQT